LSYRIEAISESDSSQSVSEDSRSQINYENMKSNQYVTAASKYANARPEFQRADRGTKEDSMDYTVSVNESSNNF
jgi:hypothetical protein